MVIIALLANLLLQSRLVFIIMKPQLIRKLFEDKQPPIQLKQKQILGKILYAVFFRSTGLVRTVKLEEQKSVIAKWYTKVCLPKVLEEFRIKELWLHHILSSHTAELTKHFLEDNKIKIIAYLPYSPDLAMCNF